MAEYIERDKAIDACFDGWNNNAHDCAENIRAIPAADVRPVVRGKWKLGGYGQISDATEKWYDQFLSGCFFYCSACKERSSTKTHFCPNCGADMREES